MGLFEDLYWTKHSSNIFYYFPLDVDVVDGFRHVIVGVVDCFAFGGSASKTSIGIGIPGFRVRGTSSCRWQVSKISIGDVMQCDGSKQGNVFFAG